MQKFKGGPYSWLGCGCKGKLLLAEGHEFVVKSRKPSGRASVRCTGSDMNCPFQGVLTPENTWRLLSYV